MEEVDRASLNTAVSNVASPEFDIPTEGKFFLPFVFQIVFGAQ
jgi:hypothetical protein